MRKLNLGQWTELLELATGIVVIITLVFVGIEIRQNTAAIKMDSYQTAMDKLDDRHYLLATELSGQIRLCNILRISRRPSANLCDFFPTDTLEKRLAIG